MGYQIFGSLGTPIRNNYLTSFDQISGGTIVAKELILGGGSKGVVRSQNYDNASSIGWAIYGDGDAYFSDVFAFGSMTLTGSGAFRTAESGQRIELSAATPYRIDFYSGHVNEVDPGFLQVAQEQFLLTTPTNSMSVSGGYIDLNMGLGQILFNATPSGANLYSFTGGGSGFDTTLRVSSGGGGADAIIELGATPHLRISADSFNVEAEIEAEGDLILSGGSGQSVEIWNDYTGGFATQVADFTGSTTTLFGVLDMGGDIDMGGNDITMEGGYIYGDEGKTGGHLRTNANGDWIAFFNGNYGPITYSDRVEVRHANLDIANKLRHYQDTDTYLGFSSDQIVLATAGNNALVITEITDGQRFSFSPFGTAIDATRDGSNIDSLHIYANDYVSFGNTATNQFMRVSKSGLVSFGNTVTGIDGQTSNQLGITTQNTKRYIFGDTAFIVGYNNTADLYLNDELIDIGNHETLRLDRLGGGSDGVGPVGYFSSWLETKTDIKGLDNPRNPWWKREWFLDLDPISYRKKKDRKPFRGAEDMRIIGFYMENLIENTNLLTTKGIRVGDSPDEQAILAVTVDYVQHLEERVRALEEKIAALT